jgi:hypothetical protein
MNDSLGYQNEELLGLNKNQGEGQIFKWIGMHL